MATNPDYIKRGIQWGALSKECRKWRRKRREATGSRRNQHSPETICTPAESALGAALYPVAMFD
jgi:hypothetical protein